MYRKFGGAHLVDVDIHGEYEVGNLLTMLANFNATIVHYVANGPAGGNPQLLLKFNSQAEAMDFEQAFDKM